MFERVGEMPGGRQLLDLAQGRDDVELVGGATRDLLLGRVPRELDVVVGGGAAAFAAELARELGVHGEGSISVDGSASERFGTAAVAWTGGRIDVATRRREYYLQPGALPQVRGGTPEEDLYRRDFTVNALAVGLGGASRARLRAASNALEDLAAGRLRVMHERSFLDDPTRLLRMARYLARLGFEAEPHTAALAATALAAGALGSVSRARVGAELRLALGEDDPLASLRAMSALGVLAAIEPRLHFQEALARRGLAELPPEGRGDLLLLGSLLLGMAGDQDAPAGARTAPADARPGILATEGAMFELLEGFEFSGGDRDRAIRAAMSAGALAGRLAAAQTPSQIRAAVDRLPLEAVALAAALEGPTQARATAAARSWLGELRGIRLRIGGEDLLAAGVRPGPEVGRRLAAVLDLLLDGRVEDTFQAQLRAALEALA